MIIKINKKRFGSILTASILLMSLNLPSTLNGQNVFQKLTGKETVESNRQATDAKKQKKQKGSKKVQQQLPDATELSLDENVASPEVPVKQKELVKSHITALAKKLAKRKTEKIETMRDGEVIVATIATDLLFAPNDTVLMPRAKELLRQYANLTQKGLYKILLVVHTDDTGSDEYTDWLSEMRVEAVYQEMTANKPQESIVLPYALGSSEPLVPNNSRANRALNRRLEIFIVPDQKMINLAKSNKLTVE